LLILPYLSIDLFFLGAPFLLRSERELKIYSARVSAAILIAGAFFLVFPLRYAFARPQTGGWTGAIFARFLTLDAPFNLFPSLHAALWVLLLQLYGERLGGIWWWAMMIWFVLIGASPLLTHQHHVIDIGGGLLLGLACLGLIGRSFRSPRKPAPP
jgi:membrane-associated phospholipid phosphatase